MKKITFLFALLFLSTLHAQDVMTPEKLWQLGRVSALGVSKDGSSVIYRVTTPSVTENDFSSKVYAIPVAGGAAVVVEDYQPLLNDSKISPNGKYKLYHEKVKLKKVKGEDYYPEMEKSDVQIYDALHYRHWDTYQYGEYNHVLYKEINGDEVVDIMEGEPYHTPQMPFGGSDDYIWSTDGSKIYYVSKKKEGTAYVNSTNTDIYEYDLTTKLTKNITESNKGYDTHPEMSVNGDLAWLQMKRDGYESDKNDIIVKHKGANINLTGNWDNTVNSFTWAPDGEIIYFTAATNGTVQLFSVNFPGLSNSAVKITQITRGDFDVTGIVGFVGDKLILTRTDFNHANEIFSYQPNGNMWQQLTQVNSDIYDAIDLSQVERRWVKTTDDKDMLVWVIYPPNFDETKTYPALLYLQGGPQGALTQFYSFRWNFQVMAAQGYIVVAPNRRGMPGHGVAWNEQISKDWGGQAMDDYLSAIDALAEEPFVDNDRIGAVGASYGGYSAFYLAGIHDGRFKSIIAHAGVFNLKSMYGTTEELFFVNWDIGGAYWETDNKAAQKTYTKFNPIDLVNNWDTPMLVIHGAKDYRVPLGQGMEAFQVLQQKGIKSRFVLFPDENHWILTPQNGMVWQREFFRWLEETL